MIQRLFCSLFLVTLAAACTDVGAAKKASALERGRYIVDGVGLCHDCHTPRDEKGQLVMAKALQGAPIPFTPTVPMPWASVSIPIAGLPTLTDDQAVKFLTAGTLPGGRQVRPPMPPYRMTPSDARDVVAYLRTLAPSR